MYVYVVDLLVVEERVGHWFVEWKLMGFESGGCNALRECPEAVVGKLRPLEPAVCEVPETASKEEIRRHEGDCIVVRSYVDKMRIQPFMRRVHSR